MRLEGWYGVPVGGQAFAATDAVARRVPILASTKPSTGDQALLAKQRKQAATTSLASFTI